MNNKAVNDANYPVTKRTFLYEDGVRKSKICWRCPFYVKWCNMLKRCYNKKWVDKNPTYSGCEVTHEWLTFSKFREWMSNQDWEGKHLDKDLLYEGNKTYGPDTCVFIDQKTNTFMLDSISRRGVCKKGVHKSGSKFVACIGLNGRSEHLGRFDSEDLAHQAWLDRKKELAIELALRQDDVRVSDAILRRFT